MVDITVDQAGNAVVTPQPGTIIPSKVVIAHHIAPLVVLLGYGGLFMWFMIYTTVWFVHLKTDAQTGTVAGWIGGTQTMMAGLAGFIFKFYTDARYGDGGDRDRH